MDSIPHRATLKSVLHLDAILLRYDSVRHYIGRGGDDNSLLPAALRHQNGIVNVPNGASDIRCFLYAILAQLHYDEVPRGKHCRVSRINGKKNCKRMASSSPWRCCHI